MKHSPAERLKKTKGNKKNRRYNKYVKKTSEKGKVMASRCESVVDLSTLFSPAGSSFFLFFSFLGNGREVVYRSINRAVL